MKVLNFGSVNIDIVYELEHIVKGGETISTKSLERFPGGKGLNQSVALAQAGVEVYHAGCIGEDGIFLKEFLESKNVNTQYLKIISEKTGNAIIQVDESGENAIMLYSGANKSVSIKQIEETFNDFTSNDYLLLQNEINNISEIIKKANEKNMKIIFNPAPMDNNIKFLPLEKIDVLVLNETELEILSGKKEKEKGKLHLKEKYPDLNIVLTLGKNGSTYFNSETDIWQKAYKVKAVDTTGAGDTYIGFLMAGMLKNLPIKDCLELASKASAIAVMSKGAANSIPALKEVENFRL